ncbi:MAG TPA: hypothetical protein VGM44_15920 [Polyangiaceae bacterium]|jgi:hypothetical protein
MSARFFRRGSWWLVASATWVCAGCDVPLKTESLIQETRVLGARVEVAADPGRASPAPGESAHLRVFVAAPDGLPNVSYAFSLCGVTPSNAGFPNCVTAPFATAFQPNPAIGDPQFDFQIPSELDPNATPHGFLSGIVCPNDSAVQNADDSASCASTTGDTLAFEFDLAGPGEDNQNPTFAGDSLTLDGGSWDANDATASCDSLTQVNVKSTHRLGVTLVDSDFDSLQQVTSEDPMRETILLSQFSTAGDLDHTFVTLTPSAAGSETNWLAPSEADADGTIVHFYFVVRDSRGGEDLAERALCLTH